jgi:hypothetical protein
MARLCEAILPNYVLKFLLNFVFYEYIQKYFRCGTPGKKAFPY